MSIDGCSDFILKPLTGILQAGEIITATGHPPKAGGTYGMSYPEIVREDGTVIPSSLF